MGGHYGSIQVRSEDREHVRLAADEVARAIHTRMLIGPLLNGWVGIYPEGNGQDQTVGEKIAQRLDDHILQVLVHDDDVFAYWFYEKGKLVDSYHNKPGYFGDENLVEEEKMVGNPQVFAPLIGDKAEQLLEILDREKQPLFAYEQLDRFGKILGIENALAAYEYLKDGERQGVKGWRKFEEVPADRLKAEKKAKQDAKKLTKAKQKRLMVEGLLLVAENRTFGTIYTGATADGFVSTCADPATNIALKKYSAPWKKAQQIVVETTPRVKAIEFDAGFKRVILAGDDRVRVCDVESDRWTFVADLPEHDLVIGAAISADGKMVAHASRNEIVVTKLSDMTKVCSFWEAGYGKVAFHPTEPWLVASANKLGLIELGKTPKLSELFVGGKENLATELGVLIQSHLKESEMAEYEKKYRTSTEAAIEQFRQMKLPSNEKAFTEERLEAMRNGIERNILDMRKRLADMKEGRLPGRLRPSEQAMCAGFSGDGRWLWCGTNRGVRAYEWASVPREPGSDLENPRWSFSGAGYVYSVVEELRGNGLVFCSSTGSLYRMDLLDGTTRELIKFPDKKMAILLTMSTDGKTIAMAMRKIPSMEEVGSRNMPWVGWELWDYGKLQYPAKQ